MELEPPDEEEMSRRLMEVERRGLPFLVAEEEGEIAGYGYATLFRPRPGYRFTVEDSVYVRADCVGRGVGRRLLAEVMRLCREAGYRQMIAVIGGENPASVAMHAALGFSTAGVLRGAGWKFDQPQDITFMQSELG